MTKTHLQWILLVYFSGLVAGEVQTRGLRVVHKLVGGHISLNRDDDIELITSSAGEGKGSKKKTSGSQEEKKTLAQQVADGKYALIQSEIFSKPIKKPGVISYRENSEVPHDTVRNLGGLNKSDIWLSENHLLVIKGGSYPAHSSQNLETDVWPAIDDYNAPGRQVKIPAHPKVPPPFPVQLTDNGPLLLLGTNASKTINGTFESSIRPIYPEENYVPDGEPPGYSYRHPTNSSAGETPFPIPPFAPPGLDYYDSTKERPLNSSLPFFPFIGPENLPSLDNVTYDEDDPSIYYPPPYSFYYQQDNSTEVPPGPLVPGIVLPPPPNFFAPLEENINTNITNKTRTNKPSNTITTYEPTVPEQLHGIYTTPKTTTTSESINVSKATIGTTTQVSSAPLPLLQNVSVSTPVTPVSKKPPTVATSRKKYPTITILKAITTTIPQINKEGGRSFKFHRPPPTRSKTVVTTTHVPLKNYYTTTQIESLPNNIPHNKYVEQVIVNIPKTTTSSPPARYYFYDENIINTTPSLHKPQQKYNIPEYYVPTREVDVLIKQSPREQNIRYYYVNDNPVPEFFSKPERSDTFSIHIARLREQIHTYQSTLRNNDNYYEKPIYKSLPKPLYQYSFEAADYQNQQNRYLQPKHPPIKDSIRHYNVEIQKAVEVTPPAPVYKTTQENNYYYTDSITKNQRKSNEQVNGGRSKSISEYSFEATPNPIFQQLYTEHDEPYIDDVTKEYFTVFGKKLPVATTPIPPYSRPKYINSGPKSQVQGRVSLERDTFVNYFQGTPHINQDAEYVENLRYNRDKMPNPAYENYSNRGEQLKKETPYVEYKLPGDEGTHFYFITPKLAQKREQNASFFYSS